MRTFASRIHGLSSQPHPPIALVWIAPLSLARGIRAGYWGRRPAVSWEALPSVGAWGLAALREGRASGTLHCRRELRGRLVPLVLHAVPSVAVAAMSAFPAVHAPTATLWPSVSEHF